MILKKLREFLDNQGVKYTAMSHSQAFTAEEVAAVAHIPGKELAKTVVVKIDGKPAMVVLPASDMVDLKLLKKATGCNLVELAGEQSFMELFPECEIGAMPPFGNLYGLDTIAADDLAEDEQIAFNAGSHRELVKMTYYDFLRLVQPRVMKISIRKKHHEDEAWKLET